MNEINIFDYPFGMQMISKKENKFQKYHPHTIKYVNQSYFCFRVSFLTIFMLIFVVKTHIMEE